MKFFSEACRNFLLIQPLLSKLWIAFQFPLSQQKVQCDIYQQTAGTCSLMISSAKNPYSMIYLQVFILLFIKFVSYLLVCALIFSDWQSTFDPSIALPCALMLFFHALFLSFISHIHPMSKKKWDCYRKIHVFSQLQIWCFHRGAPQECC